MENIVAATMRSHTEAIVLISHHFPFYFPRLVFDSVRGKSTLGYHMLFTFCPFYFSSLRVHLRLAQHH